MIKNVMQRRKKIGSLDFNNYFFKKRGLFIQKVEKKL